MSKGKAPYKEEAERLNKFISVRFKGVQKDFAKAIDQMPQNTNKYTTGNLVYSTESSFEKLRAVGLNPDWYLTGEGEMLYKPKPYETDEFYKIMDIKVYEAPAHALEGVLIDSLDVLSSSVKKVAIEERYLKPDDIIGFRASGNSMIGVGIYDDSLLYVTDKMKITNNSVVLVNLNGCIMVKLFKDNKLYSVPAPNVYEEIKEYIDDNCEILGKVFKIETNI